MWHRTWPSPMGLDSSSNLTLICCATRIFHWLQYWLARLGIDNIYTGCSLFISTSKRVCLKYVKWNLVCDMHLEVYPKTGGKVRVNEKPTYTAFWRLENVRRNSPWCERLIIGDIIKIIAKTVARNQLQHIPRVEELLEITPSCVLLPCGQKL